MLFWLAVAGVAALLAANPLLFQTVQYAGAAYQHRYHCAANGHGRADPNARAPHPGAPGDRGEEPEDHA